MHRQLKTANVFVLYSCKLKISTPNIKQWKLKFYYNVIIENSMIPHKTKIIKYKYFIGLGSRKIKKKYYKYDSLIIVVLSVLLQFCIFRAV